MQRRMTPLLIAIGLIAAAILAVAAPALAKGPQRATITGPGIDEPVVVSGNGEFSAGSEFGAFVESTGFWQLVFGGDFKSSGEGVLDTAPTADLGDEYLIRWDLGSSDDGEATATSVVYPNADGGPYVYVEPGTWIAGYNASTVGGWFAAPHSVREMFASLVTEYDEGMADPVTPSSSLSSLSPWAPSVAAITVAAVAIWVMMRAFGNRPSRHGAS